MTNKKKCKHVCRLCNHHLYDDLCQYFSKNVPNCVTGETDIVYDKCMIYNKDGCCKEYSENEKLVAEEGIIKAIIIYQDYKLRQYGCDKDLVEMLCDELKYAIRDEETSFYYNTDRRSYCYKYDNTGNYTEGYKKSRGCEDDKKKKKKSWWRE